MAISRKDFLRIGASAALFTIVPRRVLGGRGFVAPSDQITKGIIGTGSMGRGHYNYGGTRLVAVCDVDKNHLDAAVKAAPEAVAAYRDYRDLIKDANVDIVHIATPPHWHGIMAIEAAAAGKDIWCEKPMTRTIGEGKRLMEAVKRHGNIFRLNTWFRFEDNFYGMGTTVHPIKKLVESGLLGWPLTVTVGAHTGFNWKFYWVGENHLHPQPVPKELDYDLWLGPAPYKPYHAHRTHNTFRGYWDYDGGGLGDMGQHYLDPVQYFLGKDNESPVKVEVDAPQQHHDAVGTWRQIIYTYADGCKIILNGEDFGDPKAPYIQGPKGKLYPGFVSDIPNLGLRLAELPDPKPQYTDFMECVKNRQIFALNEINGFRSSTIVNIGLCALRLNRTLHFDSHKLEFMGDEQANRLIDQPMRTPWNM
ncbi:MAG: Gfo/Idh/MocA family oxidoreductase [Bacteroidales bacterium]|nr:Gfo/Idh/MocA family oxidoreductase [Bacteroidales bacterium]MCL2738627.1 Gfo/Idh/MocA family oxidoreductase [Bacteroidales bacterium]